LDTIAEPGDAQNAPYGGAGPFTPRWTMLSAPRLRVLVVDDEPDTRASMAVLLRLWGHEACEAGDGPAALEAALRFRPHAVLLDLGLPGMDGCAVAWRLRRAPELEGILLLTVTGHGDAESVARASRSGCDRHLLKPADPQELCRVLRERAEQLASRHEGCSAREVIACRG
jgi:CheY-like chemotaxis protein